MRRTNKSLDRHPRFCEEALPTQASIQRGHGQVKNLPPRVAAHPAPNATAVSGGAARRESRGLPAGPRSAQGRADLRGPAPASRP
ncbi:MAG: hypothetical protein WCL28_12735, partial [bacterium]